MNMDDVRRLVTHLMQCFLDSALETQFVVLENADVGDEFVQFKLNHRILYGEVGSREWAAPEDRRPLDTARRALLAALGFTHGGPERNYICDNLAQSAPYLADLYLRLADGRLRRDSRKPVRPQQRRGGASVRGTHGPDPWMVPSRR